MWNRTEHISTTLEINKAALDFSFGTFHIGTLKGKGSKGRKEGQRGYNAVGLTRMRGRHASCTCTFLTELAAVSGFWRILMYK